MRDGLRAVHYVRVNMLRVAVSQRLVFVLYNES